MIRRNEEKLVAIGEHQFAGDGHIIVRSLLNNEGEMYYKGRVFAHTTLPPNCSVGSLIHSNEPETYYIYRGIGEFNDNGTLITVSSGEVTFTPAEQGHRIKILAMNHLNSSH